MAREEAPLCYYPVMKAYVVLIMVFLLVVGCGGATKIAYMSTGDSIYIVNSDGSNPTRVTTDRGLASMPCWSNNDRKLVFSSTRNNRFNIVIIDTNGDNETVLDMSILPESQEGNLGWVSILPGCWHPNSDRIMFTVAKENGTEESNVYEISPSGKNLRLLIPNAQFPSWSPNGDKIVYHGGEWRVSIADSNGNPLEMNIANAMCVSWSEKQDKLVCSPSFSKGLFTINPDGTERTPIEILDTEDPNANIDGAFWSPDGKKILYTFEGSDCYMYTINADGTQRAKLINKPEACFGAYSNN